MITDVNCQREDWELFFSFEMAAKNMEPFDNKRSVLDMELEPVTYTDQKFWKWADQILILFFYQRLGPNDFTNKGPIISPTDDLG